VISTQHAITRARRDLTIGALLKGLLFGAAVAAVLVQPLLGLRVDALLALTIVGVVWLLLGVQSMRSSRLIAESPSLIASGQYDAAEQNIAGALHAFSMFRAAKLLSLHHLAALRHAQSRFGDAAVLCRALLGQLKATRRRLRGNASTGDEGARVAPDTLGRSTRLILADSLLEMNDLRGAGECIAQLYDYRLSLGEALSLMLVQLDYESRIGAWPSMMRGAMTKVSLAELMPSQRSARAQALLALAAKRVGRDDWCTWLRRRVELLLGEPTELVQQRPILRELWIA
jgi:hypothetical protein